MRDFLICLGLIFVVIVAIVADVTKSRRVY
jgi:hypothetical protein